MLSVYASSLPSAPLRFASGVVPAHPACVPGRGLWGVPPPGFGGGRFARRSPRLWGVPWRRRFARPFASAIAPAPPLVLLFLFVWGCVVASFGTVVVVPCASLWACAYRCVRPPLRFASPPPAGGTQAYHRRYNLISHFVTASPEGKPFELLSAFGGLI